MAENLKTTKYKDGTTSIPNVTEAAAWITLTTPAYCWYNNDGATYKATYGAGIIASTILTLKGYRPSRLKRVFVAAILATVEPFCPILKYFLNLIATTQGKI